MQSSDSACRGAILIEFAVCMPILLILLFYIHDLVKLKRYHSQTEFVAQQMANILQNISQKRSNKAITANDIRYAASLAYLSVFPGKTRFLSKTKTSDLGYNPLGYIYCIKGVSNSKASVLWARRFHAADGDAFAPDTVVFDNNVKRTNVKNLSEVSPSDIYPTLKINSGEIKIILECAIHYSQWNQYFFSDGRCNRDVSPSQAFGLKGILLSAPVTRDGSANKEIFFSSAVIFTPKPGLFSETAPS